MIPRATNSGYIGNHLHTSKIVLRHTLNPFTTVALGYHIVNPPQDTAKQSTMAARQKTLNYVAVYFHQNVVDETQKISLQ